MAEEEGTESLLTASSTGRPEQQIIDISRGPSCLLADGLKGPTADSKKVRNKLIIALIVCFIFMGVEVVGGVIANSLAVLTDAAHLLSDVSGFGVALFANYYSTQSSLSTHTFGYHRMEVLGALVSVLSTWLVTGILLWEAVVRIQHPEPVDGKLMFLLALVGVAVNVVNFAVLGHHGHSHGGHDHSHNEGHSHSHSHGEHAHEHNQAHDHDHGHGEGGHEENMNLKGAVLHVIGDLVQSLGVAVAGALIWWNQDDPRWRIADPICTFLFALLVLLTTRAILRDISDILMERVPRAHDAAVIQRGLEQIEGVEQVHDLHVWALTPGIPLLAVHLNLAAGANGTVVLQQSTAYCKGVGIDHSTIQISVDGEACCVPRSGSRRSIADENGEQALTNVGGCNGGHSHEDHKHDEHGHNKNDGHGH